jgi:hypothetical protein
MFYIIRHLMHKFSYMILLQRQFQLRKGYNLLLVTD